MKLRFKSVAGSQFTVDVESTDTIASLKGKIESEYKHPAANQKIIYSGTILSDASTIQSTGVSEKDFLVLMVSKPKVPKAAPAPAAAAAAPSESSSASTIPPPAAQSTTEASGASVATPEAPPTAATSAPAPAAATTGGSATTGPPGSSQFLVGSALEEAVNNMVEMGFEKSEVQKAMRASFNNPDRAVEYLMTGIPEHLLQPPAQEAAPAAAQPSTQPQSASPGEGATGVSTSPAVQTTTPAATTAATPPPPPAAANPRAGNLFEAAAAAAQGGGAQGGGGAGGLSSLQGMEDDGSGRSMVDLGNPAMLAQLRQLVQQNPAALNPLVQALAQSNPRLANAMAEDPEGVLNLLAAGASGGEEGEEGMTLPAMDELNPEDRTAVEQIIAMGIPENKAIEAYLMCGRNVEMAVQYYFENPQDFDD